MVPIEIFTFLHQAAFGDFAIAMIVVLLGLLVWIAQTAVKKFERSNLQNMDEHKRFISELSETKSWKESTLNDIILPTKERSERNEIKIGQIETKIGVHDSQIKSLKRRKF